MRTRIGLGAAFLGLILLGCGGGGGSSPGGGPAPPDPYEPNDTPAACYSVGDLIGVPSVPAFTTSDARIDPALDEDFFCFSLSRGATARIEVVFDHASGNLDLELLNSTLAIVAFSISFTDDERISVPLPLGSYSVRIFGGAGAVNTYRLSMTAFWPDPYELNDDPSTCAPILLPFAELGLSIHDSPDEDWFCFTLPPGPPDWDVFIDVLFQHSAGDLDLDLWDSNLNLIRFSQSRDDNEQIQATLPPGDYLVRIYGFGGSTNRYDMNIIAR